MAPRELSVVYLLSGELGVAEDVHVQIFSERYKSTKDNFNCYQIYHTRSISKSNTFIIIFILYIYMHPSNELLCMQVEERTDLF